MNFIVKDSGARQEFSTGARRDIQQGKGRFDLVPSLPLRRLAHHFENGSRKYGERNFQKGIPLMRYIDSALRHINSLIAGEPTEDHATAASWNMFAYVWTLNEIEAGRLPSSLDDRPPPEPQYDEQLKADKAGLHTAFSPEAIDEALRQHALSLVPLCLHNIEGCQICTKPAEVIEISTFTNPGPRLVGPSDGSKHGTEIPAMYQSR